MVFILAVSVYLIHVVLCDKNSLDCPMRQLALEFAQEIQPWLAQRQLQEIADALNGAEEANNCSVFIPKKPGAKRADPVWNDMDMNGYNSNHIFVDYAHGDDDNDGTMSYPLKHIQTAIHKARQRSQSSHTNDTKYIILRGGKHYLNSVMHLNSDDSHLIITNYNNEIPEISGAKPLDCQWTLYKKGDDGKNIYKCKMTNITDFDGLRVNGTRAIRARYPNGDPEIDGFGSNILADSWFPSTLPTKPDRLIYSKTYPVRNNSAGYDNMFHEPYFWWYNLGIEGPCKYFTPPAGYWCSGQGQGGFAGYPWYIITTGLTYNATILPNAPYRNTENGIVHAWHPDHWATWMFEIDSKQYDPIQQNIMFLKGGYQGARGAGGASEFYVENIFEELDDAHEWYFNITTQMLYYYSNYSGLDVNKDLRFERTDLKLLFNLSNTTDITLRGLVLRDTAHTFMDPHGMPSGGDWALQRTGAIYIENSDNIRIENNLLTRLDGIGISINKYARNITIYRNEIAWNGATSIAAWGDTYQPNDSLVSSWGMGYDGTRGTQPRFLNISYNYVHELGLWEKQSSFYFEAKSCQNYIGYNIFFNGPRAGINFNDGFGGGSVVHKNLLFNTCRESGDHGPINTWDRQVYVTKVRDGKTPSTIKQWDIIHQNFIIANYHSSMAIDNDDGSCYYHSYHNFLVYSPCGLKNNFGGHSNYHYDNIYAYISACFQTDQDMNSGQFAGYNDLYQNNTCVLNEGQTGTYGQWNCTHTTDRWPILGDNIVRTLQEGANNETGLCGLNEISFQQKYNMDIGTQILGPVNDSTLLHQACQMLWRSDNITQTV
eukprot:206964_1